MERDAIFQNLQKDENGVFLAPENAALSYPEEGNALFFGLEDRSFWFQHRNDVIAAAVMSFPPAPQDFLLDIGGGNGFVTRRLLDEGFSAVLLEPGRTGARNAKMERNIPRVLCATLEQSGIPEESMGAVGCFDVLEHVEEDKAFLSSMAKILKPGGMFYLTVPAGPWLWSHTDIYSGHYRRYGKFCLLAVLGEDFEPLYYTCFFGWLVLPLFFLKALPSRLGLLKRENVFSHETEHGADSKIVSPLMRFLLRKEIAMIRKGKSKSWGTSCLLVARRRG